MVWGGPQGVCEGHEPDSIEVIVNGGDVGDAGAEEQLPKDGQAGAEGQLPEMVLITVDGVHSLIGPTGEVEGQLSTEIDVIVTGGEAGPEGQLPADGQLPETVLTTVDGVQVPTPPTGDVEGHVSTETLVIVAGMQEPPPTLIVLMRHEVIGVQLPVPTPPTGDVGEQVSTVEILVTGTHSLWDGHDPLAVIVIGGSVEGEQVPTPPTGELDAQLGVSVIVTASQVPLPQVEELPDPYPQEVSDVEADRGTTGFAAARMLKDVSNAMMDRE